MKFSKRFLGVTLSVAMLASQVVPSMASSDVDPEDYAGGTGNVLSYSKTQVVVPTSLKIALNPDGYAVNMRYIKVPDTSSGSPVAATVYYTYDSSTKKYSLAGNNHDGKITEFAANTDYYTAVTSGVNDQIVSLNYGIANKSTSAKNVGISFAVTASTEGSNDGVIEFVDTAEKATAEVAADDGGAKLNELKMYLAVASASAVPTAETKVKSTDAAWAANTDYYTFNSTTSEYTKVDTTSVTAPAAGTTYYKDTDTIGPAVLSSELSDVTMTKSTEGNVVFAAGEDLADAEIAYSLGKGEYTLKPTEFIDWGTTQEDMANKLELSAIGGVTGFTFTGAINKNADWTQAKATALDITPTYEVTAATGSEAFIDEGDPDADPAVAPGTNPYKQIVTTPASVGPDIATKTYTMTAGQALEISYTLGTGDAAATGITSVMSSEFANVELYNNATFVSKNEAANKFSLTAAAVDAIIGKDGDSSTLTVKFDNNDEVVLTLNDPA